MKRFLIALFAFAPVAAHAAPPLGSSGNAGVDWLYQFANNLTALTTANGGALTSVGLTELSFISFIVLVSMVIRWSVSGMTLHFHRGDILFGKLRPYFHKVGPAPLDGVCSTDIVVLYPKRSEYAAWLLMLVSSDDFVAHTDRSSAGTKMPRTNWNDMAAFPATVPPSALGAAFQERTGPMLELIAASIHESRKLAALRDYLLPRLLSGQVRVRSSQGM